MSRTFIVLSLACLLSASAGGAEVVVLNPAVDALSVEASEARAGGTVIDYELGSFSLATVEIDGREYHQVRLGDESVNLERGLPGLPDVRRSIVIPDDARMSVRVIDSHYTDFEGIDVAPSKGEIDRTVDPETVPYEFDAFYQHDAWFPAEVATMGSPYVLRGVRGAVVIVNPFHYNPGTHTLRVYDRIRVEAKPDGPGEVNVLAGRSPSGRVREFEKVYEQHFLNYDAGDYGGANARYTSVGEAGSMLVISYGDFMTAMEPFVEWKRQMGVPCEMVDVSAAGATAEDIRDYIQSYYDSYGVTYVLFVGDAEQIPSLSANGGSSDPSFTLVAGEDYYPDIFVGRFSAENVAEVETQVLRTVEYESAPQAGADWYHLGTGIASSQGPGDDGEYDDEHSDNLRDDLLGFTYTVIDQVYDPGANPPMVTVPLNEGRSIINYTGHGSYAGWSSSDFTNAHVNALVNDNMLPFIWSVACSNGMFAARTCFAETWLRATNGSEPTGAVAVLMSSINQDWDEPMDAQDEMVDLLVAGAKQTFGGLSMNGCCHMLDEYGVFAYDDFLSWHTFGDPSLRVRTDTPSALTVDHASTVPPSATIYEVNVDGVDGALCALSFDGELYGCGMTDASGDAVIDIETVLPATQAVTLTVTAMNSLPYVGSVQVDEASAAIIDVSTSFLNVSLETEGTGVDTIGIGNQGEPQSILYYDIDVTGAGMSRGNDPTGITVSPAACEPGATLDLVFTLSNESTDGEWVKGASLRFPDGVTVNSCTDFSVSDRALFWNGATGDGATVVWSGNWWNVVYPDESASATVSVTVEPGFTGNVDVLFGIEGDGHGDPPHELSGVLMIDCDADPLFTLLTPNGNEAWGVGETHDITWEPSGYPLFVDIFRSTDGGGSWTTVVAGTEDDGEHPWIVDAEMGDEQVLHNCLMKVSLSSDPDTDDVSDASFSIFQPVEWLSVSPSDGSVQSGDTEPVEVAFDATGMPAGDYFADIVVASNGGDPVVIPVSLSVGATGSDDRVPGKAVVYGNYPNPFHPSTRIAFSLPRSALVSLFVYSVDGRLVRTLLDEAPYGPGRHAMPWDGRTNDGGRLPDGVYFYRFEAAGEELSGKMILLQ